MSNSNEHLIISAELCALFPKINTLPLAAVGEEHKKHFELSSTAFFRCLGFIRNRKTDKSQSHDLGEVPLSLFRAKTHVILPSLVHDWPLQLTAKKKKKMGKKCGSNVSSCLWRETLRDNTNYIKRASKRGYSIWMPAKGYCREYASNRPMTDSNRENNSVQIVTTFPKSFGFLWRIILQSN